MKRFTKAIVRTPCKNMVKGLTNAGLGIPDYELAMEQHKKYVQALIVCGLDVIILDDDPVFPDSTFVEDTALLTPSCAVISNPGAPSRKGEVIRMQEILKDFFDDIEYIREPGTLEPGDVMMAGPHYYIGLSDRTNTEGAGQLTAILEKYGMKATTMEITGMLHLKSGLAYLEHNKLLAMDTFIKHPAFSEFEIIPVPPEETYAANALWINDQVLVARGYPQTMEAIKASGYQVIELDVSEFRKLDGGLSCLSLRF
jgi:dimethylargininase